MIPPIDIADVRIETQRLILRPWREDDWQDFYEYASVDGVGQMAGWQPHASIEETKFVLNLFVNGKKTLAIEEKKSGKVIGSISLDEQEDCSTIPKEMLGRELGYALNKAYWGAGMMPEAIQGVCRYCFAVLGYDYLSCGHFDFNQQSRRVIEKCGFSYVGDTVFETRMGTQEHGRYYVLYNPAK